MMGSRRIGDPHQEDVNYGLPSRLPPVCQGMRISVAAEEQGLEEQHAGGPDCRCAAKPGEDKLADQGLDQEEQESAQQHHRTEQNHMKTTPEPEDPSGAGYITLKSRCQARMSLR